MIKLKSIFFNKDYCFIFLAVIIIIISLYPFWLFGEHSSLGWYDEMDGQIPWNHMIKNNYSEFYYSWSGGIGKNFGYGIEYISLYRGLCDLFPLWIANNIIRFFSLFTLFLGIYIFNKFFFTTSSLLSFSSALFALFASYYPYGWTLGGMGFDLSIAVWLAIVFFVSFKNIKINYLIGFLTVLIAPSVSSFVFSFVLTFFLCLAVLLTFYNKIIFNKQKLYMWGIISILYIIFMILNWSNMSYHINEAREFSTRLLEVFTLPNTNGFNLENFIFYLNDEWIHFQKLLNKFSLVVLIIIFKILIFLSIIQNKYKELLISSLVLIFTPIVLIAIGKTVNLDIISNYRWTIIWLLIPLMVSILITYFLSIRKIFFIKVDTINKYFFIILEVMVIVVLLYKSYIGAKILSNITLHNLHYRGGNSITFHYKELNNISNTNYRVVSDSSSRMWWSLPLYYSLGTFDGIQPAMPHRRSYFIAYGLNSIPRDKIHHSKHFLSFSHKKKLYNLNLLKMANIKYILSHNKKISFDIKKELIIKGIKIKDIYKKNSLIYNYFKNKNLAKDLYVYKLENPWEKVFIATRIKKSKNSYKDQAFYKELQKIERHEVLVSSEDGKQMDKLLKQELEIKHFLFNGNSIQVNLNGMEGLLVLNQVYTPQWHAECNGAKVSIIPVNGIMMSFKINKNCKDLNIRYR